jgi:hypothetical protein
MTKWRLVLDYDLDFALPPPGECAEFTIEEGED